MNANIFLEAVDAIETEKGISRDIVLNALRESLEKATKKQLGKEEDAIVRVDINEKKFEIKIYHGYNAVEEVEDDFLEKSLDDARLINENAEIGDVVEEEINIEKMSKATAQLVASVFKQKIAEAEKAALYDKFKDVVGQLITGDIEKIDSRSAIVNIAGRTSVYLPRNSMIPNEDFRVGDKIKLYVSEVKNTTKGAQITVSRTDPGFLKCLFEDEVHEIYDGTVIIKNIAREAGERSKVAVYSLDPNVPATGACIGQNGVRIQKIVAQLGNGREREKIDIINYNENPGLYIMEALKPANVLGVTLDEENKSAVAVVKNDELSLAIGKLGVNARLAVKLTGWKIDIKELDVALRAGIFYKTPDELRRDFEAKKLKKTEEVEVEETNDVLETEEVEDEVVEPVIEENKVSEDIVSQIETETEVEEEVEEVKEIKQVVTTKSLADLEKQLEDEKRRLERSNARFDRRKRYDNDKNKNEDSQEDVDPMFDTSKVQKMDIYTEEELRALESEEETDDYEDDDIDYEDYDSYYDN